ncbi:BrnA antitoxin family protein [Methylobacterium sp. JK268]
MGSRNRHVGKATMTIRLAPDVLASFRERGRRYQFLTGLAVPRG